MNEECFFDIAYSRIDQNVRICIDNRAVYLSPVEARRVATTLLLAADEAIAAFCYHCEAVCTCGAARGEDAYKPAAIVGTNGNGVNGEQA